MLISPIDGIQILFVTKYKKTNIIVAFIVSKTLYINFIRPTSHSLFHTPYMFNINVKYIPIFIIYDYRFYLLFTLYFYFHGQ